MESEKLVTKIKIKGYQGYVPGDEIFTEGSVHYVVEPPKGHNHNGERGYWVQGAAGRPILILNGEFEIVESKSI